jgi:hypothetical protein
MPSTITAVLSIVGTPSQTKIQYDCRDQNNPQKQNKGAANKYQQRSEAIVLSPQFISLQNKLSILAKKPYIRDFGEMSCSW